MSGTDYARALTEFWSAQGQAMLEAQEQAARAMTAGMQALLGARDLSSVAETWPMDGTLGPSVRDLWQAASALFTDLSSRFGQNGEGGNAGEAAAMAFAHIADPRQWLAGSGDVQDALTRLAEAPRLADLFDIERRSARVMSAWMQLRRRSLEHQTIVLDAWLRAGRRYAEESAGVAAAERQHRDPKRALALWTETANRVLIETQRSEPFLNAQRELVRAATELRIAQQDLVEHFGSQYGFPTRTELDDVHRSLTEMRRELRRMRRELATAKTAPHADARSPAEPVRSAPAPRRRRVPA